MIPFLNFCFILWSCSLEGICCKNLHFHTLACLYIIRHNIIAEQEFQTEAVFEVGGSVCEALKPDLCVSYRSYNYIGSIAHNDIITGS